MARHDADSNTEPRTNQPAAHDADGSPHMQSTAITLANQHDGSEHLAVNDTWWRRWLILASLKTTAKLYRKNWYSPIRISNNLLVKISPFTHLAEAATMQYVASNTSIPVPHVYCAFVHKNRAYIVMERVKGRMLSTVLEEFRVAGENGENADKYDAVADILAQLRTMITELRTLPPAPSAGVSNSSGGSLCDCRITRPEVRFGPFKSIHDFHFWLRKGTRPEDRQGGGDPQETLDVMHMVDLQDGPWPPPVFIHGDLSGSNILVRDGKVASIIDWKMSGWYPSYWEYTASWYAAMMRPDWQNYILPKIINPCSQDELKMEITRQRWWGQ